MRVFFHLAFAQTMNNVLIQLVFYSVKSIKLKKRKKFKQLLQPQNFIGHIIDSLL